MLGGHQVFAIVRAENYNSDLIKTIESSAFISLLVLFTTDEQILERASADGQVAHLVIGDRQRLVSADFIRAITDSNDEDVFMEGDPYIAYFDATEFRGTTEDIEVAFVESANLPEDTPLAGAGFAIGRLSTFRRLGSLDGPQAKRV